MKESNIVGEAHDHAMNTGSPNVSMDNRNESETVQTACTFVIETGLSTGADDLGNAEPIGENTVNNNKDDTSASQTACDSVMRDQEHVADNCVELRLDNTVGDGGDQCVDVEADNCVEIRLDNTVGDGGDQCVDVEAGSSSLLQIQMSDCDDPVRETEPDSVYDISLLFSGELDKQYKKEWKKAKRKSWKTTKTKRKRKLSEGEKEEEEDKMDRKRRPMPNYFVSIQITNPEIHKALGKVQEDVILANEKLKPAMNKLPTLHLTMLVLHLGTEEELERSKQALDQAALCLQKQFEHGALVLDLCGLGNFRDEVVFARVSGDEQVSGLQHIARVVEDCFLDQGLVSPDKHGFKPHVTVMKLTRAKSLRAKGIKKIDKQTYTTHVDASFGTQVVDALQLCAMLKKKDASGYYHVEHSVQIGKMSYTTLEAAEKQEELIVESVDECVGVSDTYTANTRIKNKAKRPQQLEDAMIGKTNENLELQTPKEVEMDVNSVITSIDYGV